jgi:predicted RNA-binding protein (virulence factor B family)
MLKSVMEIIDIQFLEVISTTLNGAFLRYKDGFDAYLPNKESFGKTEVGFKILVAVFFDPEKNKYWASEKILKYLQDKLPNDSTSPKPFVVGQEVEGIIYSFTNLGINIAIDKKYTGVVYTSDIYKKLYIGDKVKVFIKTIREDGKIDLALRKIGFLQTIGENTETILFELTKAGGELPYNDKSTPEEIGEKFQMSKRNFKDAIGKLFKEKKIVISEKGIALVIASK